MEASALQAPVGLARHRSVIGDAVLRLRSDEQLVALVRAGHEEAFHAIHDRYRARLYAYMRQMLPLRQDAEDALQEVFERAYTSLQTGERELALRPWLYRIAHNRCIDQLRRPVPPPLETMLQLGPPAGDPVLEADRKEALRRLMADLRRLPQQQRSALLMRELGGISYVEVADALGVTIPAVKSLLVRARVGLVQAAQARETACEDIRAELVLAHEGRMRPNATARRHLRDCTGCREFRGRLRGVRRQLLALAPGLGPCGLVAKLLGGGGTGGAGGGGAATACGGSAGMAGGGTAGVAGGGGLLGAAGALASSAGHVATLIAATVVTAGGAAALQHTIASPDPSHAARPQRVSVQTAAAAATPSASADLGSARATPARPTGDAAPSPAPTAPVPRRGHSHWRHPAPSAADQSLAPLYDPGVPAAATQAPAGTTVVGCTITTGPGAAASASAAGLTAASGTSAGGSGASANPAPATLAAGQAGGSAGSSGPGSTSTGSGSTASGSGSVTPSGSGSSSAGASSSNSASGSTPATSTSTSEDGSANASTSAGSAALSCPAAAASTSPPATASAGGDGAGSPVATTSGTGSGAAGPSSNTTAPASST